MFKFNNKDQNDASGIVLVSLLLTFNLVFLLLTLSS